jgi:casein kinase I homolog HRR25
MTEDERDDLIKKKKLNISVDDLCYDLPKAFATYLKYVRDLGFDDQPNYSYLRKLLRKLFVSKGFEYDCVFD